MLMMTEPSTDTASTVGTAAALREILMVTTTVATEAEAKRLAHAVLPASPPAMAMLGVSRQHGV